MRALKRLADQRPVWFGLLITVLVLLWYVAAAMLGELVADDRAAYEMAEAVGRVAASLFFLHMLCRFGWLETSGVSQKGALQAWVLAAIVLTYDLVTTGYALFGSVGLVGSSDPMLTSAVAANALTTGLIEEIPFRGIILYSLVRLWGDSRPGVMKAVLISSLLFGASHLIHILLGRPIPQAILVAAGTFLSGIFYAGLVLRWRAIWTVVALHGVANAAVAIRVLETPGFAETVAALGLMIVLQLPLTVLGVVLIYRAELRAPIPEITRGRGQEVIG